MVVLEVPVLQTFGLPQLHESVPGTILIQGTSPQTQAHNMVRSAEHNPLSELASESRKTTGNTDLVAADAVTTDRGAVGHNAVRHNGATDDLRSRQTRSTTLSPLTVATATTTQTDQQLAVHGSDRAKLVASHATAALNASDLVAAAENLKGNAAQRLRAIRSHLESLRASSIEQPAGSSKTLPRSATSNAGGSPASIPTSATLAGAEVARDPSVPAVVDHRTRMPTYPRSSDVPQWFRQPANVTLPVPRVCIFIPARYSHTLMSAQRPATANQ